MKSFVKSVLVLVSFVLYASAGLSADQNFELITMPEAGVQSVTQVLDRAKTSLKISMFHLSQNDIIEKIIDIGARGVKVQIILDDGLLEKPRSQMTVERINKSRGGKNIEIRASTKGFSLTHTKAAKIDDSQLFVSTINFSNAIPYSRDFGLIVTNTDDIKEFDSVFENDWKLAGTEGSTTPPLYSENLVWSPVNSKERIVALIDGATKTINIQIENLGSFEVQKALKAALRKGVKVRFVMSMCADGTGDRNWPFMDELIAAGAKIKVMQGDRDRLHPYIHSKIILVDNNSFFLGSENFSRNSLDYAREVGIIAESRQVVASITNTFETDWSNAIEYKNATRKCEPYQPPPKTQDEIRHFELH